MTSRGSRKTRKRRRRSYNVHTVNCMHAEPGVTICTCWMDIERWAAEDRSEDID